MSNKKTVLSRDYKWIDNHSKSKYQLDFEYYRNLYPHLKNQHIHMIIQEGLKTPTTDHDNSVFTRVISYSSIVLSKILKRLLSDLRTRSSSKSKK